MLVLAGDHRRVAVEDHEDLDLAARGLVVGGDLAARSDVDDVEAERVGAERLACELRRDMSKLKLGMPAPDFDLIGTGGKRFRLADYKDTGVILAFYPGDFTPVCTKQFCSYRDDGDRIEALGVPMLGVSPQSVESHEKFTAKHGLRVPLLADADKSVAKAYGVVGPGGMIRRSVFLIDEQGIVRYRDVALLGLTFRDVDDLEKAVTAVRPAA